LTHAPMDFTTALESGDVVVGADVGSESTGGGSGEPGLPATGGPLVDTAAGGLGVALEEALEESEPVQPAADTAMISGTAICPNSARRRQAWP
jgi:hypothetical protein